MKKWRRKQTKRKQQKKNNASQSFFSSLIKSDSSLSLYVLFAVTLVALLVWSELLIYGFQNSGGLSKLSIARSQLQDRLSWKSTRMMPKIKMKRSNDTRSMLADLLNSHKAAHSAKDNGNTSIVTMTTPSLSSAMTAKGASNTGSDQTKSFIQVIKERIRQRNEKSMQLKMQTENHIQQQKPQKTKVKEADTPIEEPSKRAESSGLSASDLTLKSMSIAYWDNPSDPPYRLCQALTIQCNLNPNWLNGENQEDYPVYYGNTHWQWKSKNHPFNHQLKTSGMMNYLNDLKQQHTRQQLSKMVVLISDAFDVLFFGEHTKKDILHDFFEITRRLTDGFKDMHQTRVIVNAEYACAPLFRGHLKDLCTSETVKQLRKRHDWLKPLLKSNSLDGIESEIRNSKRSKLAAYVNSGIILGFFDDVYTVISSMIYTMDHPDQFKDLWSTKNGRFLWSGEQAIMAALNILPFERAPVPLEFPNQPERTQDKSIPALENILLPDHKSAIFQTLAHDLNFNTNARAKLYQFVDSNGENRIGMMNRMSNTRIKGAHLNGWKEHKLDQLMVGYVRKQYGVNLKESIEPRNECRFRSVGKDDHLGQAKVIQLNQFCHL